MNEHRNAATPLRILLLAPQPYYIDRGTPIDVDILVRALCELGHQVDLVCYPEGEARSYPGLVVHRISTPRWLHGTPPGFTWKKVVKDLVMLRSAVRLARRTRYDLVHAGEEAVFLAMMLKRLFGVPYVYDMDSSIAQQMVEQAPWLGMLSRPMEWTEAWAIRRALAVAPVCHALADLAAARGAEFVETLHDISQLRTPDREPTGFLRRELGISGPILMYVGNLAPYQGVGLLLESLAHVRDRGTRIDLVVAGGSESDVQAYEARAESLSIGDRTHFIGPWPNDRLEELLAEADILTAPRTKGINTPMKIFPYLHTGKPVLVTDLVTHNQILDSSVAMLAPADPEGFGEAIEALARDPGLRGELGRNGRRFVEQNHTYGAHLRRVRRLYSFVESALADPEGLRSPPGAADDREGR